MLAAVVLLAAVVIVQATRPAEAGGIAPVEGFAFGQPVEWDYTKFHEIFTTLALPDGLGADYRVILFYRE